MKQYFKSLLLTLLFAPLSLLLLWQLCEHTGILFGRIAFAEYEPAMYLGVLVVALLAALVFCTRQLGRWLSRSGMLLVTLAGLALYIAVPIESMKLEQTTVPIAISDIQSQQQERIWHSVGDLKFSPYLIDTSLEQAPVLLVSNSGDTVLATDYADFNRVRVHVTRLYGDQLWTGDRDIPKGTPLTAISFSMEILPSAEDLHYRSAALWLMGGGAVLLLFSLVRRIGRKKEYSGRALILAAPLLALVTASALIALMVIAFGFSLASMSEGPAISFDSWSSLLTQLLSLGAYIPHLLPLSIPLIVCFVLNTTRSYMIQSLLALGGACAIFYFETMPNHEQVRASFTIPSATQSARTLCSPHGCGKLELTRLYSDEKLGEKGSTALLTLAGSGARLALHQGERSPKVEYASHQDKGASLGEYYVSVSSIKPKESYTEFLCNVSYWHELSSVNQLVLLSYLLLAFACLTARAKRASA